MRCLSESELQGYLEESGPSPLRLMVEEHLVSCAGCRASFDRVVATHQRVNAWLSELAPPADSIPVNTTRALSQVLSRARIDAATADGHLDRLLAPAAVEIPWYVSLYGSISGLIRPQSLPPLQITSRPVAVKEIWGLYARNSRSRYISIGVHAANQEVV